MRRNVFHAMIVLWAVMPLAAQAAEETRHDRFTQCVLHKGEGGHVWVGKPLVSLGMIGVMGSPPIYRLSPTLAVKFQSLVNELKEPQKTPDLWLWGLPRVSDPDKALVVVQVEFDANLRKSTNRPIPGGPGNLQFRAPEREYEITSFELLDVEFIAARWREAWDGLDSGLREIVAASRTPPGTAKRERLERAIEKSSRCLGMMVQTRVEQQSRDLIARLAPKARVVRTMQQSIQGEWGGQLRQYVAWLRLPPRTPLPSGPKPCPKLELLAASNSPQEFLTKIRQDWPADVLDERLIYAQGLNRTVAVWEVEGLAADQFHTLHAQAKEQLAREEKERQGRAKPGAVPASLTIPSWGVVLRRADSDLLADKGLLQGMVVESISAEADDVGLRAGDVIIGYDSVYDLTMAQFPSFAPTDRIKGVAGYGGKLDVLRGDRILTIEVRKK